MFGFKVSRRNAASVTATCGVCFQIGKGIAVMLTKLRYEITGYGAALMQRFNQAAKGRHGLADTTPAASAKHSAKDHPSLLARRVKGWLKSIPARDAAINAIARVHASGACCQENSTRQR